MALLTKFLGKTHFSAHHRPHTHSWDSSPFIEVHQTQPSPFDHRTDRTLRLYGFINKISSEKPPFSPHHLPHTFCWDSSLFTEAQLNLPSPFDNRTHPQIGRTGFYVSMALLTKFLGKTTLFTASPPSHTFLGHLPFY